MVPAVRWLLVAVVAVGLAAAPAIGRAIPPKGSDVGATTLAHRIRAADDRGWSGEVRLAGSAGRPDQHLGLLLAWPGSSASAPTSGSGGGVRPTGASTGCVAPVSPTSSVDGGLVVRWNYEGNRVSFTPYSSIRLPDDADVVPVALAHRMLAGATADELSRLPSRRIAGHSAAGLRLVPSDPRSTITQGRHLGRRRHRTPAAVDVYGIGKSRPVLSTRLISVNLTKPTAKQANFALSSGLDFSRGVALDDAAGANAFAPFVPPARVVRLPRLGDALDFGAVGVYGRGPTAILAIPLRDFVARGLRTELRKSTSSRDEGTRIALEIGPISVLLADVAGGHFLIAGTVTPATLLAASKDLETGVQRTSR